MQSRSLAFEVYIIVQTLYEFHDLIYLKYRTHLTGAINHGTGVHTYIDLLTWPHDANLVINILLDVISRSTHLTPVLFLQLDNTARENKNQYVLAFMAYLIEMGIFSEVC